MKLAAFVLLAAFPASPVERQSPSHPFWQFSSNSIIEAHSFEGDTVPPTNRELVRRWSRAPVSAHAVRGLRIRLALLEFGISL
jgi:hypothetical protein